jgi:uracil-DNA glycosylase
MSNEISNCSKFFDEEILSLKKLKVIVTLGKVAYDNCMKLYNQKFDIKHKIIFKHGKTQILPNGLIILSSYHPSPRNVNTKLISNKMMITLFKKAKKLAKF